MKSIKIFSVLFFFMSFVFTACTEEADYDAAKKLTNEQVYFPSSLLSKVELSKSENSFDIELKRIDTADALSVDLIVSQEGSSFTIPKTTNFQSGSESTTFTITYDPDVLEYDDFKSISIAIAEEGYTTTYGKAKYEFQAGIPAPWESLGMATFTDYGLFEHIYEVEIQKHMLENNRFRLVDPYSEAIKKENASTNGNQAPYLEFEILQNGLVKYPTTNTGVYNGTYSEDYYIMHPSGLGRPESAWTYNIVKQYSDSGEPEVVQLAPLYIMLESMRGSDLSQQDGAITIIFPGVELMDYSVIISNKGRYTDETGADYAVANVIFGEDVASAKVALIEGNDVTAAIENINNGSLGSIEITANGEVKLPCTKTGQYTFVVVTYNSDGEYKGSASLMFRFVSSLDVETWTSLGIATYTDGIVAPLYGEPAITYQVELQESEQNSGKFRMVNPYGEDYPYNEEGDWDDSKNYYIEINATDPQGVYIDFQNTGLDWGEGNLYAYSYAAYFMDNGKTLEDVKAAGYCGSYTNGAITFPASVLFAVFPDSGDMYTTNRGGEFKLIMPGISPVRMNHAIKSRNKSGKKNLNATPIKMIQLKEELLK